MPVRNRADLVGGGGGGTRADLPIFLLVNIFLEPYICPYANTCLKISLYKDLLCVCATGKIQFDNTILVSTHIKERTIYIYVLCSYHTHPQLVRYASSRVPPPPPPPIQTFWIHPRE